MLSIVLVEDELRTRQGLKKIITKASTSYKIIGEASNGNDGYELVKTLNPDVVISDIKMPFCNGIEMLNRLSQSGCRSRFILLTGHADFEFARSAITIGVDAYLLKPIIVDDLLNTLEKIAVHFLSPEESPIPSCDLLISSYLKGNQTEEVFQLLTHTHYKEFYSQDWTASLIHVPFYAYPNRYEHIQTLHKLLQNYNTPYLLCDLYQDHFLLLIPKNYSFNYDLFLNRLHMALDVGFGILCKYILNFSELINCYKDLLYHRLQFLSYTTKDVLIISEEKVFLPVDTHLVEPLERKFSAALFNKSYNQCLVHVKQMIQVLTGKNYLPNAISYHLSQLWTILMKASKSAINNNNHNFNYTRLMNGFSNAKTQEEYIYLFSEVLTFLKSIQITTSHSLLIDKTLTRIHTEYMYPITLSEIADSLSVTHIYLSSLFHQEIGQNFKEYLTTIRMKKAQQLLSTTSLKVYEVASSVGYNDSKHFCTVFKKHTGFSPSQYQSLKN